MSDSSKPAGWRTVLISRIYGGKPCGDELRKDEEDVIRDLTDAFLPLTLPPIFWKTYDYQLEAEQQLTS